MTNEQAKCEVCGVGSVRRTARAGRTHEYRRGLELPVPADVQLDECDHCGEIYLDETDAEALHGALRGPYLEWQKTEIAALVERITDALPGIMQREIERALGVTGTYLSHLLAGRKEASRTLLTLLEEFALHPRDVRRKLDLRSWRDVPYALPAYVSLETRSASAQEAPTPLLSGGPAPWSAYKQEAQLLRDGSGGGVAA